MGVGPSRHTHTHRRGSPAWRAARGGLPSGADAREGRIEVVVEATAFVRHMVRNLVGTLVEVGQGKRAAASIPALLASADRTKAGRTAPPQGLFLDEVFY